MIMSEFFNQIDSVAHTDPTDFKGIAGLSEQISGDLFLPNGVFSLWAYDSASPI